MCIARSVGTGKVCATASTAAPTFQSVSLSGHTLTVRFNPLLLAFYGAGGAGRQGRGGLAAKIELNFARLSQYCFCVHNRAAIELWYGVAGYAASAPPSAANAGATRRMLASSPMFQGSCQPGQVTQLGLVCCMSVAVLTAAQRLCCFSVRPCLTVCVHAHLGAGNRHHQQLWNRAGRQHIYGARICHQSSGTGTGSNLPDHLYGALQLWLGQLRWQSRKWMRGQHTDQQQPLRRLRQGLRPAPALPRWRV